MSVEKKTTARKQVRHYTDYRETFSTPQGRRVLLAMMKEFFVMGSLPRGDLEFAEGQRSVVLSIIKKLNMNVQEMLKALEEYERNEED